MSEPSRRRVTIERVGKARLRARNQRGGELVMGEGADGDAQFTPVELLLAAIGGCTGIDVDYITERRAQPTQFEVEVSAAKVHDDEGNRLEDIRVGFRIRFPDGADGDAARAILPLAVQRSHDRLCTVSRTVIRGTPIATSVD